MKGNSEQEHKTEWIFYKLFLCAFCFLFSVRDELHTINDILPRGASHRFFFLIIIFFLRSLSMLYSIEHGASSMMGIPRHAFDLIGKFP